MNVMARIKDMLQHTFARSHVDWAGVLEVADTDDGEGLLVFVNRVGLMGMSSHRSPMKMYGGVLLMLSGKTTANATKSAGSIAGVASLLNQVMLWNSVCLQAVLISTGTLKLRAI